MMINLEDDNVRMLDMSVEQVRAGDVEGPEELVTALDEAQGDVFTGEYRVSYLVIRITS
jgi:hypothetical protein